MRKNIIIILVVAFALIFGRMFLSHLDKEKSQKQNAKNRTIVVTATKVGSKNITREYYANARVVAKYRVDVLARINGYLTKSYFKEGDYVKKGQVLFEIEPQEYQYAANKAKANLDNASSQYNYYQKQLSRYEELVKNDYIARADYDSILAQRDAYKAQVANAESAYRDTQRNLGYTHIKSPVDGRVGIIDVTVGNYVSASSGPLTTINSNNPMYITFPLAAKDYAELVRIDKSANANRKVEFSFSSGKKYEFAGVQDFHDNKIDETTGTITMRATFPNPKDELLQGDFGRIVIYSNQKDETPVIPQSAVMQNQEGKYVYVLDEKNIANLVYIKTGPQIDDGMWVVNEGLEIGDRIITTGLQKVIPGTPVKVVDKTQDNSQVKKTSNIITNIKKVIKSIITKSRK